MAGSGDRDGLKLKESPEAKGSGYRLTQKKKKLAGRRRIKVGHVLNIAPDKRLK